MDAGSVAEQVLTAGTALAGLILVFLGNIVSGYESYERQARASVRARFQRRGWFAFVGFTASLLSAFAALAHNWADSGGLVFVSVAFLILSLVCVFVAAFLEVWGIR